MTDDKILSPEEVAATVGNPRHARFLQRPSLKDLRASHEALRADRDRLDARLAEVERERDAAVENLLVGLAERVLAEIANRDAAQRFADAHRESERQLREWQERCAEGDEAAMLSEARVAELEAALREYGWHLTSCTWTRGDAPGLGKRPCSCGFDAALLGEQPDER